MSFELNSDQRQIIQTASKIGEKYGPEYWYEKEENHEFPQEFLDAFCQAGFIGLGVPEEYGGIGAGLTDQVLAFEGRIISKPEDMEAARAQLLDLSGKTHTLHTSVAVANNGVTVWAQTDSATLTMRKLSPEFIGHYLAAAGEAVLSAVGAYQIESIGIQLFEKIDGDFFSILGLPLLPLLDTLRREGVIES